MGTSLRPPDTEVLNQVSPTRTRPRPPLLVWVRASAPDGSSASLSSPARTLRALRNAWREAPFSRWEISVDRVTW